MTPTLVGRWHTRIAMLATLGLLVTILFAIGSRDGRTFLVLLYVLGLGLLWDVLYNGLQQMRWDRDWPAAFQFGAGIFEGVFLFGVIATVGLPGIAAGSMAGGFFLVHYGLVWLATFLWVQGPMRALFPRWRFDGGQLG